MTQSSLQPWLLLVEDDPNDIMLFRRALGKVDHNAILEVAETAEQAQQILTSVSLENHPIRHPLPSLILMDLKLPGKSGQEMVAWIRARDALRRLIIVMFTNSKKKSDVALSYTLGANAYVIKPNGFEPLLDAVKLIWNNWLILNETPHLGELGHDSQSEIILN